VVRSGGVSRDEIVEVVGAKALVPVENPGNSG